MKKNDIKQEDSQINTTNNEETQISSEKKEKKIKQNSESTGEVVKPFKKLEKNPKKK